MGKVFPIITGISDIPFQENLLFENLKHLTDSSITKTKSDRYDRSRPVDLKKQIRKELEPYIVSLTNIAISYLSNFFTKEKESNKNTSIYK